jgi:hypothetical protein
VILQARSGLTLCGAALVLVAGATGVSAPSGGAREIAVTPALAKELRAAAIRYHRSRGVRGPLRDSARAAEVGGARWAIATFSVPGRGLTGQPELLKRVAAGPWFVVAVVGPALCGVPRPVLEVWRLERRAKDCASPPGGRPPPEVGD